MYARNSLLSKIFSNQTKIRTFHIKIWPVLLYGTEMQIMNKGKETILTVFKHKMLRKIIAPTNKNGDGESDMTRK